MVQAFDRGKVSDMSDRDNISDETPIADAVEQEQETRPGPASLHQADRSVEPPMDANTPDWQEQWQEVSDADSDDREEYRE
jgi:hypothetical protein